MIMCGIYILLNEYKTQHSVERKRKIVFVVSIIADQRIIKNYLIIVAFCLFDRVRLDLLF